MTATKVRGVRFPDELWLELQRAAAAGGETVSDVLRRLAIDYIGGNLPGYTSGFVVGYAQGESEGFERASSEALLALGKSLNVSTVYTGESLF